MSVYADQLKDPRWQRKRLQILERDNWVCTNCGNANNTLHVHHRYYVHGAAPWDYDDSSLVTLCGVCHRLEHALVKRASDEIAKCMCMSGFSGQSMLLVASLILDIGTRCGFNDKAISEEITQLTLSFCGEK